LYLHGILGSETSSVVVVGSGVVVVVVVGSDSVDGFDFLLSFEPL